MMQNEDGLPVESPLPSGRVNAIRQQWALHEDEALAHKLQDEEITQHYCGNRTRNAIVREDVPKAREEQRKEEQEALEFRFKQLNLLQQQAEEDSRIARLILEREEAESAYKAAARAELNPEVGDCDDLDFEILDRQPITAVEELAAASRIESLLLVGGALGYSDELLEGAVGSSPGSSKSGNHTFNGDFDERHMQEENDAEIARKLQEELEMAEKDRMMAIEAQDRELAKMIHEKEKARLKRAKERAKLKAAAAASSNSIEDNISVPPRPDHTPSSILRPASATCSEVPPRIPDKTRGAGLDLDDPIGFRASPKPLPPQPTLQVNSGNRSSTSNYSPIDERHQRDPIPPYMPMQGFNRSNLSPRKSK